MNDETTIEAVTKEAKFHGSIAENTCLFAVCPGIPVEHAASAIHSLADAVESLATNAMCDGEMDANVAYLVSVASGAIAALSESLGA